MTTGPTIAVKDLVEFRKHCSSLGRNDRWIFRGQKEAGWKLETTLERTLKTLGPYAENPHDPREIEDRLLREFQRHFHRYANSNTRRGTLEWLSIMQHHGAPTRLSDWTYSEYVALFFAIREIPKVDSICSVFAVNQTRLWQNLKRSVPRYILRLLEADDKDPRALDWMLSEDRPILATMNPFRFTKRLAIQQGTFLVPLNTKSSLQDDFEIATRDDPKSWRRFNFGCSKGFLQSAFTELQRFNVSEASLFPGIDGLARAMVMPAMLDHLKTMH